MSEPLVPITKSDVRPGSDRARAFPAVIYRRKAADAPAASAPSAAPTAASPPEQRTVQEILDGCAALLDATVAVAQAAGAAQDGGKIDLAAIAEAMDRLNWTYSKLKGAATDQALGQKPGTRTNLDPHELVGQPRRQSLPAATKTTKQIIDDAAMVGRKGLAALDKIDALKAKVAKEVAASKARGTFSAPVATQRADAGPSVRGGRDLAREAESMPRPEGMSQFTRDIARDVQRDAANRPPPPRPLTAKEIAKRKLDAMPMDPHGFPADMAEYVRLREIAKDDPKATPRGQWPDDIAESARLRDAEERAEERVTGMARSRNPYLV